MTPLSFAYSLLVPISLHLTIPQNIWFGIEIHRETKRKMPKILLLKGNFHQQTHHLSLNKLNLLILASSTQKKTFLPLMHHMIQQAQLAHL